MFGSGILDLVIGLIFIYFILSLACSAIREIFANIGDLRYRHLRDWFKNIFKEDAIGDEIMNHHLIAGLTTKNKKPSYIPDNIFSTVVFDLFVSKWGKKETGEEDPGSSDALSFTFDELKAAILKSNVLKDDLKRILVQFAGESDNLSHFRTRVEVWFNQSMIEAAGTYKQRSQWWIIFVSIIATVALNVDSVAVSKFLYENPEARENLADLAESYDQDSALKNIDLTEVPIVLDSTSTPSDSLLFNIYASKEEIKAYKNLLKEAELPIGWNSSTVMVPFSKGWWTRFFGWLMTALAVSMGAPFWFDLLNKLSNLRASSKPPSDRTPMPKPSTASEE